MEEIAPTKNVEMSLLASEMKDGIEVRVYVVRRADVIRTHCMKLFLAAIRIRIVLSKFIERLYSPPNGAIFKRLVEVFDQNFLPNLTQKHHEGL